jgi:hypothetical protein
MFFSLDRKRFSAYARALAPEETPVDRRSFLRGCAGLSLTGFAHAGDKAKPQSPDIERLIQQLGRRRFR